MLRFVPRMAPIKVGHFPAAEEERGAGPHRREIQKTLQPWMTVFYDDGGAVGRRYRRQDEVGTPFCITVDFDTLGENGRRSERHRHHPPPRFDGAGAPADRALLPWLLERVR